MAYYNKDIKEIYSIFSSSANGLSKTQVEKNQLSFGKNEIEKQTHSNFIKKFFQQFKNIMIIILLISSIISCVGAIYGNDYESLFEGILIFAIVIINALVGVVQEQKAENALNALSLKTEPFASVLRGGVTQKIKAHELVVGDIISLKSGNFIPADIRIISCDNFKCNESSLTGESQSVIKQCEKINNTSVALAEQNNMCFSGTTVESGKATGIVVSVGKNTEFGKIAKILNNHIKEKTPLERNIDKIGKAITIGVLVIVSIVFGVQVFINKNLPILDSLLTAVALAVAAIPESLPAVITIIMALGVQKLAKQNAIIKKLNAVETLGCCNIICTDKTGTLTKNLMTVKHICSPIDICESENYNASINDEFIKIFCVCNSATILNTGLVNADATETAIIKFLQSKKINFQDVQTKYTKFAEQEFDSSKKIMTTFTQKDDKKFVFIKGALDYILPKCNSILINGKVENLSKNLKEKILKNNELLCKNGERVIAFAKKEITDETDENGLVFVAFLGIIDPPRNEVNKSIQDCKKAGLKTIMISGDHPTTAFAIAKMLGIAKHNKEVLSGADIDKLTEQELSKIISNYSVFARVTPEHKMKIVSALKKSGNIVAMTGDGVNDAPSIKNANIGISMGITGTDVTKEVADVIIADDNFSTIVVAIKEGRTIYQNITKTIIFLLSTNIVEVLGIFVASLVLMDSVFLTATQILFINLITDSLPAFSLGIEPAERNIMSSPPRDPNKSLLSGKTGSTILYQGFIQTLIVLTMFVMSKHYFGNSVASTMSFFTICLMQIIHAINCKTDQSIFKTNIFKNKFFNFSFIALLVLIIVVYFIPVLSTLFNITSLSNLQWLIVIVTSISIIPLVEIGKLIIKG